MHRTLRTAAAVAALALGGLLASACTMPTDDPVDDSAASVASQLGTDPTPAAPDTGGDDTGSDDTATALPPFPAQSFSGSSDDVLTIPAHDGTPLVVESHCDCEGNFAVQTDSDLLVNAIGSYTGTHWLDVYDGDEDTQIQVTADGPWTVKVRSIETAAPYASGKVSSDTDAVFLYAGQDGIADISCAACEGNFAIETTGPDLLVNAIGAYTGTVPVDGPTYIQVTADAAWTINFR
jgi:hypothetical protein